MIQTESLSFQYTNSRTFDFPDISLSNNESLLIIGESGIGKTTLLHLLSGILSPDHGKIVIDETDITKLSHHDRDHFRGQTIGIVYQRPHFIRSLTLNQHLDMIRYLSKKKRDRARAADVLQQLNLENRGKDHPNNFSQGEQQRASIAMAVLNHPRLILADEPTSSLDDRHCRLVIDLLQYQAENTDAHLIVITHDARLKSGFMNTLEL